MMIKQYAETIVFLLLGYNKIITFCIIKDNPMINIKKKNDKNMLRNNYEFFFLILLGYIKICCNRVYFY